MMPISIQVITYKGQPVSNPVQKGLTTGELSIGRKDTNQIVLPDDDKFVSSLHARISSEGDVYYITDMSTNGVFINKREQSLGKNKRTRLHDGDQLTMGEYDLQVSITAEMESAISPDLSAASAADNQFGDQAHGVIDRVIGDQQTDPTDLDDPFADFSPASNQSGTDADHLSPLNEAFSPQQENIPVDASSEKGSPVAIDENNDDGIPENWMLDDAPSSTSSSLSESPRQKQSEIVEDTSTMKMEVSMDQILAAKAAADAIPDSEFIQNFLAGTGLSQEELGFELTGDTFKTIGNLFQIMILGLLEVMASRSEIKNEFRLDVTTLRSVENNPVKFSLNVNEAMIRLLSPPKPGYMSAEEAVSETFDDLRAHQIAVLSGMQKSLHDVLHLFNPEKLEQRLQKHNPISASIPIQKRAKLWDLFEELYEEIEKEASDNFNELFGASFADAYEEQSRQLKKRKNKYPGD